MRKILTMLSVFFVLASCTGPSAEQIEAEKERNDKMITSHFRIVTYKGHDYIFYESHNATNVTTALTHDPDCQCTEWINNNYQP